MAVNMFCILSLSTLIFTMIILIDKASSLDCYKCQNVQLTAGCNKFFGKRFRFQTDAKCQDRPDKPETCSANRNCGYLDAAIIGQTLFGRFSAKYQRRACFPSFTQFLSGENRCRQVTLNPSEILKSLTLLRIIGAKIMFQGKLCTCPGDRCLPDKQPMLLQEAMPEEARMEMQKMIMVDMADYPMIMEEHKSVTECYPDEPLDPVLADMMAKANFTDSPKNDASCPPSDTQASTSHGWKIQTRDLKWVIVMSFATSLLSRLSRYSCSAKN